jgi:hypothetical protein
MPNHPQPSPTPQITYPPPAPQITYPPLVPQITYPAQNSTNPQVKTEANPPLPPPPQIQEPQQQNEAFPSHGTILTITRGSNTDFDTKRQRQDYYREVNHVAIKGPVTQTKWSHIPITFSTHIDRWDVSRILILMLWSSPSTLTDGTFQKSSSTTASR